MAEQATMTAPTARSTSRSGGWVYLDPEDARAHPSYGVYGWALFLLAILFVGPMVLLWQDVEIAFGAYDAPQDAWILVAIDALLLIACWTACRKLGAEHKGFYAWFIIAIALGLCSLAAFVSLTLGDVREILPSGSVEVTREGWRGLVDMVPTIVWWGIALRIIAMVFAIMYVMQSQRVNVTISRRVSTNDAFIARAWSAPTGQSVARGGPVEPQAPGYGGSSYPPMQTTTSDTATVAAATAATVATAAVTEASAATRAADAAERAATAAERVADQAERRTEEPVTVTAPVAAASVAAPPVVAAPVAAAPQPAATPQPTAEPAVPVDDRRLRARLKQLDDARAAGLISDAEFEARRQALLGTG